MAIVTSPDQGGLPPLSGRCSHCGEPRDEAVPIVWWTADGGVLVLHPRCAERLGVHLIQDSREAELAHGGGQWSRRAARAAGHALRQAEARS